MKVTVAYVEAKRQMVMDFDVADGISAEQVIRDSGILEKISDIDLAKNKIGIFGKVVPLGQALSNGDRVEIYRPAIGKPPKKSSAAKKSAGKPAAKSSKATSGADSAGAANKGDASAEPVDPEAAKAAKAAKMAKMAAAKARIAAAKAKIKAKKEAEAASGAA